jgi:hypothetical protein
MTVIPLTYDRSTKTITLDSETNVAELVQEILRYFKQEGYKDSFYEWTISPYKEDDIYNTIREDPDLCNL